MTAKFFGPIAVRYYSGAPAPARPVRVEKQDGSLASIWQDEAATIPAVNPKPTDALGNLSFFINPGDYFLVYGTAKVPFSVPLQTFSLEPEDMELIVDDVLLELEPPVDLTILFQNSLA